MFRVGEEEVFWLSVGYVESEEGIGWMDSAVMYCPFCGSQLQTIDEIRSKAKRSTSPSQG
jgi:hypothetical protein